jgi:hypothetical protein
MCTDTGIASALSLAHSNTPARELPSTYGTYLPIVLLCLSVCGSFTCPLFPPSLTLFLPLALLPCLNPSRFVSVLLRLVTEDTLRLGLDRHVCEVILTLRPFAELQVFIISLTMANSTL